MKGEIRVKKDNFRGDLVVFGGVWSFFGSLHNICVLGPFSAYTLQVGMGWVLNSIGLSVVHHHPHLAFQLRSWQGYSSGIFPTAEARVTLQYH